MNAGWARCCGDIFAAPGVHRCAAAASPDTATSSPQTVSAVAGGVQAGGDLGERCGLHVDQHQAGTGRGQAGGQRVPDAAGGAGDDRSADVHPTPFRWRIPLMQGRRWLPVRGEPG
jgi:hypothetical protein